MAAEYEAQRRFFRLRGQPGAGPVQVALTTTDEAQAIAAPGAGKRLVVLELTGSNAGASLTKVSFLEGSAGDAKYTYACAANGGGFAREPLWALPEDTALFVQQSAAVESYVTVNWNVEAV